MNWPVQNEQVKIGSIHKTTRTTPFNPKIILEILCGHSICNTFSCYVCAILLYREQQKFLYAQLPAVGNRLSGGKMKRKSEKVEKAASGLVRLPGRFALITVFSVFFVINALIMAVLHSAIHPSELLDMVIDILLPMVVLLPALHFFSFKPFQLEIAGRRRAEEALQRERDKLEMSERLLRHLSSQLMVAQEKERSRVSRELHDELGQALSLMKLRLRTIKNGLLPVQADLREGCEQFLGYIDKVIEDVRRLSRDLSPAVLENHGLAAALRCLADDSSRNGMSVEFEPGGADLDRLFSGESRTHIYRIVQEALTNAVKHAAAGCVAVNVNEREGRVYFRIEDDGKGFNVEQALTKNSAEQGLGLTAMEERVRMLGGTLSITSAEGGGSRIVFAVPEERGEIHYGTLSDRPCR